MDLGRLYPDNLSALFTCHLDSGPERMVWTCYTTLCFMAAFSATVFWRLFLEAAGPYLEFGAAYFADALDKLAFVPGRPHLLAFVPGNPALPGFSVAGTRAVFWNLAASGGILALKRFAALLACVLIHNKIPPVRDWPVLYPLGEGLSQVTDFSGRLIRSLLSPGHYSTGLGKVQA